MAKIPFNNKVDVHTCSCRNLKPMNPVIINVTAESKLWRNKIPHVELIECGNEKKMPSKGDNVGFTLIFGNDGEIACPTDNRTPSVEDTLEVAAPLSLKLMSLCLGCDYELWVACIKPGISNFKPCKLVPGVVLHGGYTYTLQLRKRINKCFTPFFDIPCQYICSASMLFKIDFPCDQGSKLCK